MIDFDISDEDDLGPHHCVGVAMGDADALPGAGLARQKGKDLEEQR
jgi:hypothetical protein